MTTPRGSSGATQQMQALIAEKGATRVQAAIAATHMRREEAKAAVDPGKLFWLGVIRNFGLGIPFTGLGYVFTYRSYIRLEKHLTTEAFAWHDLPPFIVPAVLLLVGVAFIAPGQTEAALRFLGAGNILDRLPGLKPKAAS